MIIDPADHAAHPFQYAATIGRGTRHLPPSPPPPLPPPRNRPLQILGFSGLDALEVPIIVALALGDPVVFVGRHGTAKSALVAAVARSLSLRFQNYDAAKCQFEDWIGFPDVASFSEPTIRYAEPATSIFRAQFALFDELNRANPSIQGKLLEVIRDRRLMGRDATDLKYVWAAMNPPGYLGVHPLDRALAGRFAWILHTPDAMELGSEHLRAAIQFSSPSDSPGVDAFRASARGYSAAGAQWAAAVAALRDKLPATIASWDTSVVEYVATLAEALAGIEEPPDTRRLAMIRRNILGVFSMPEHAEVPDGVRSALVHAVVGMSLPTLALGTALDPHTLVAAHVTAWRAGFDRHSGPETLRMRVLAQTSPTRTAEAWVDAAEQLTEEDHDLVLRRFLDPTARERDGERVAPTLDALGMARRILADSSRFPAELVARVLAWTDRATGLDARAEADVSPFMMGYIGPMPGAVGEDDALALRMAIELARTVPGGGGYVEPERAVPLVAAIRLGLRRGPE